MAAAAVDSRHTVMTNVTLAPAGSSANRPAGSPGRSLQGKTPLCRKTPKMQWAIPSVEPAAYLSRIHGSVPHRKRHQAIEPDSGRKNPRPGHAQRHVAATPGSGHAQRPPEASRRNEVAVDNHVGQAPDSNTQDSGRDKLAGRRTATMPDNPPNNQPTTQGHAKRRWRPSQRSDAHPRNVVQPTHPKHAGAARRTARRRTRIRNR